MNPLSKATIPHYVWGDRCDGWIFAEKSSICIKQERMPPGTSERLHLHEKAEQFFFILHGRATFLIEGREHTVNPEEGIVIPPGARHLITNRSGEELEFLLVSQPTSAADRRDVES